MLPIALHTAALPSCKLAPEVSSTTSAGQFHQRSHSGRATKPLVQSCDRLVVAAAAVLTVASCAKQQRRCLDGRGRVTRQAEAGAARAGDKNYLRKLARAGSLFLVPCDGNDTRGENSVSDLTGGLKLRIRNGLPSALLLDGLWLQSGSGAHGSALGASGVSAIGQADLLLEGPDIAAVMWFRAPQWPFATVTLAVRKDRQQRLYVTGEQGRVLQEDCRLLLEKAELLQVGGLRDTGRQEGGLLWRQTLDDVEGFTLDLTVLSLSPTALLPRKTLDSLPKWMRPEPWPESQWWMPRVPNAFQFAANVFSTSEHSDLMHRLEDMLEKLEILEMEDGCVISDAGCATADLRLFRLLGVKPTASARAIRAAWRKRAQDLHPDVAFGTSTEFDEIREAYRVLSDPVLRARYEALGDVTLEEGESEGSVALSVSLTLLLGSWAFRPLLGGSLTPPLGLTDSSNSGEDYAEAISKQVTVLVGSRDSPQEHIAEIRAALAIKELLTPLVMDRDVPAFESKVRVEFRKGLRAGKGTTAPRLLTRLAETYHAEACEWLRLEAPCELLDSFASDLALPSRSSKFAQAAEAVSIVGSGAASLAALPFAVAIALVAPEAQLATDASAATASKIIDVAVRTALLEAERRAATAIKLLLDDPSEPWQIRWRTAVSVRWLAEIAVEERQAFEASEEEEKEGNTNVQAEAQPQAVY